MEYIQNNVRKSLVREYTYLRKLKGLTQAEVAERAGISRTNISRFESGEYNPTLEMLVKLATAMDLDILVTLKPKNNNDTECDNDVTSSPPTL
ncbi:XRE family transcriptional regulator [Ruminococcus sp. AF41-9]|nr:XRE family transcriptional regulator [Ruminococcus sp. AF41-9]RHO89386.1 XRE family transcriptional regulator [Ruminococcus sp. AF42-9BH]RHT52085.1 XRE family transcriptional regulator [Ruminococcus sp. AM29-26]